MKTATFLNHYIKYQDEFEYNDNNTQEKKKAISFIINDSIATSKEEPDGSYTTIYVDIPIYCKIYDEKLIQDFKKYYNPEKLNFITLTNIKISQGTAKKFIKKDKDKNPVADKNGNTIYENAIFSYSTIVTSQQQIIITYKDKKVNDNAEVDVVIDDEVPF